MPAMPRPPRDTRDRGYCSSNLTRRLGHVGHLGQARHAQHGQTSVTILPGDGIWDVYDSIVRLGQMDERLLRVEDTLGRRMRNPKV